MSQKASLTFEHDPETSFPLEAGAASTIGRSQECDFQIADSFVSRQQAKIYHMNGQFVIENIGSNPIFVNGTMAAKRILRDNDRITLGKTELIFHLEQEEYEIPVEPPGDIPDQTIVARVSKEYGARLAVVTPDGKDLIFPLSGQENVIGRLAEADIRLDDPSVSRSHCVIERLGENFFVKNLSETNPTVIDNRPVTRVILHSGDQIRIGLFNATFVSDRPEDVRPREERIIYKAGKFSVGAWLAVSAAFLILAGFFFYSRIYIPWKIRSSLKVVSQQLDSGDFQTSHEALKKMLTMNLPAEESQKAMELFSKTTIFNAREMAEKGSIKEAIDYLNTYIDTYKSSTESKTVRDQADSYRLLLAQEMEASGDHLAALKEYSSIGEESTYYEQAQQGLSRIWLSSQQKELSSQPIDRLVQQAEENFSAKRYTTPFNNNAYAIFQTILSLEPDNALARERIDQMKLFYRENGDRHFRQKNYASALSYYERYLLIEPQDAALIEKAAACRKSLTSRHSPPPHAKSGERQEGREERVKRLFEGSEAN